MNHGEFAIIIGLICLALTPIPFMSWAKKNPWLAETAITLQLVALAANLVIFIHYIAFAQS